MAESSDVKISGFSPNTAAKCPNVLVKERGLYISVKPSGFVVVILFF